MNKEKSIFQRPLWVSFFALTAALAWGWAYPLIKLGFEAFQITPEMTVSKLLFAGIRFFISGLLILLIAAQAGKDFTTRKKSDWWFILLYSLLNTTLHYSFFYIGLSHAPGARSAILNSLSVFCVVLFAGIFYKSDKLNLRKILGCAIGIAGIFALNMDNASGGEDFSWMGDGMIILNALSGAAASLLTRGLGKRVDVFVGTGYSLALGGVLLILPSLPMGASLPNTSSMGIMILLLLVAISTIGFSLYNKLITCNPVGKIAIYNSLIPIVGAITSCLCLGEVFHMKYLLAGALATAGIYIINMPQAKSKENTP